MAIRQENRQLGAYSVGFLPWLRKMRLLSVTLNEAIAPLLYDSIDLTKTHDFENVSSGTKQNTIMSFFQFTFKAPLVCYRVTAVRFVKVVVGLLVMILVAGE